MAVGPEDFFKRIEESGLLNDSIVEQKNQVLEADSAEDAATALVQQKLLTAYQSEVLVSGDDVSLVVGDYVVTDSIGRGGMGYVLKARHRRMKRTVAIKFLLKSLTESDDLRRRFEREVEAAAQLNHQNIVTAYDAGVHDGSHYLVMEYVDGDDLSHIVKSSGPLAIPKAVDVIRQAAIGLGYAHDRGIVHRDMKPGNLLLDGEGVVRILDMGLARIMPSPGDALEGGAQADLTNTGSVMGTIDYMAPEQALDAKSVDHRADIYALGCTLYFLVTGNPPFRNDTVMRRLLAHREEPAPSISAYRPDAPDELDQIFATMMAKSPDDRFPSMNHVIEALNGLALGDSETEQRATLDMPDDGSGGFISLPEDGDATSSESSTSIQTSSASDLHSSSGDSATRKLPDYNATILESAIESPSSPESETASATDESQTVSGANDTDGGDTLFDATRFVVTESSTGRQSSGRSWKSMVSAFVVLAAAIVGFLLVRGDVDESLNRPDESKPDVAAKPDTSVSSEGLIAVKDDETRKNHDLTHVVDGSDNSVLLAEQQQRRRAAQWIVRNGGYCVILREGQEEPLSVKTLDGIPDGPFRLVEIYLSENGIPDDEFINLSGLTELETASFTDFPLADAALANLRDSHQLRNLLLKQSEVTDDSLVVLENFPQLQVLHLSTGITDKGFSHVLKCKSLEQLGITFRSKWIDSLNRLPELDQLQYLFLYGVDASATETGVSRLQMFHQMPNLTELHFFRSKVARSVIKGLEQARQIRILSVFHCETESGALDELKPLRHLATLGLEGARLSDFHIDVLSALTGLTTLAVADNDLTPEGIAKLREALPGCKINSDHGEFKPLAYGLAGWRLNFDGKDDYIELPLKYDASHPVTFEAWVSAIGITEHAGLIVSRETPEAGIALKIDPTIEPDRKFSAWGVLANPESGGVVYSSEGPPVIAGQRVHIAGVFDRQRLKLFVDGKMYPRLEMNGEAVGNEELLTFARSEAPILIGATLPGVHHFQGLIDEVRISSSARYSADFVASSRFERDADTLALYRFEKGCGTLLFDASGNDNHGVIHGATWERHSPLEIRWFVPSR